jgi:hypothetical protein
MPLPTIMLVMLAASLLVSQIVRASDPTAPLDVCDALQKIDQLDGSMVAVRGYYRFGIEVGGLYGRNCPKKLVLDRAERAQAFDLAFGATVDDKKLAAATNRLIEERDGRAAIQVTVIGMIRARRSDLTDVNGRRAYSGQGRLWSITPVPFKAATE